MFVVIYDYRSEENYDEEIESYYGYFSTAKDAERMYRQLSHDDSRYSNARVCEMVKALEDDQ